MLKGAAMNFRDLMSNSQEVLNNIPIFDGANRKRMKVLGLTWSFEDDNLSVVYHTDNNPIVSKRTVLKQIASIYDPLGLLGPVILRGKLFLQTLWSKKLPYDKHISVEDKTQ